MSLVKKTGVKNHLSARHRTEIHLLPESQADATGFPHEEPAGADPGMNDSKENALNPSSSSGRKSGAVATPTNVRN